MENKRLAAAIFALSKNSPIFEKWLDSTMHRLSDLNNKNRELITEDIKKITNYAEQLYASFKDVKTLKDAEFLASESYFVEQKYFFYNEVFTYGFLDDFFLKKINGDREKVEKTLIELASYKGTVCAKLYSAIDNLPLFLSYSKFLDYYHKNTYEVDEAFKIFNEYSRSVQTLPDFYSFVQKLKRRKFENKALVKNKFFPLYSFIVDFQTNLYPLFTTINKLFEEIYLSFPTIQTKYSKQKAGMLHLYTAQMKSFLDYYLAFPFVVYKHHIFNIKSGQIFELNKLTATVLSGLINKKIPDVPLFKICRIINELEQRKIISPTFFGEKPPANYLFYLELTLQCNLNCAFCFNRKQKRWFELNVNDWKQIIDDIPPKSVITLFGGEPFVYEGTPELIKYLDKVNTNKHKRWRIRCYTNGILTDRIIKSLRNILPIEVHISLDGVKADNDAVRGKGSFEKTIDTIKKLKKYTKHQVKIKTVLSRKNNKGITDFLNLLKTLQVDAVNFGELHLRGNACETPESLLNTIEDYTAFKNILDVATQKNIKLDEFNLSEFFLPNRCGAGHNIIYIRSDGFITSCTGYDDYESHIFERLGKKNIFENTSNLIPSFLKVGMKSKQSTCSKCGFVFACHGGCRYRAYTQTSDLNGCDLYRRQKVTFLLEKLLKTN